MKSDVIKQNQIFPICWFSSIPWFHGGNPHPIVEQVSVWHLFHLWKLPVDNSCAVQQEFGASRSGKNDQECGRQTQTQFSISVFNFNLCSMLLLGRAVWQAELETDFLCLKNLALVVELWWWNALRVCKMINVFYGWLIKFKLIGQRNCVFFHKKLHIQNHVKCNLQLQIEKRIALLLLHITMWYWRRLICM